MWILTIDLCSYSPTYPLLLRTRFPRNALHFRNRTEHPNLSCHVHYVSRSYDFSYLEIFQVKLSPQVKRLKYIMQVMMIIMMMIIMMMIIVIIVMMIIIITTMTMTMAMTMTMTMTMTIIRKMPITKPLKRVQ
jgi:hypothetical protein